MNQGTPKTIAKEPVKFGTFSGVFVPNALTILGVILFMRSGWVVGQAGVYNTLIILAVANCITLLTSLSLSAKRSPINHQVSHRFFQHAPFFYHPLYQATGIGRFDGKRE